MTEQEWRELRNSRSMLYAGRILDPAQPILLSIDKGYASRYDGQVALLTAASLFSRMTPSVFLDVPSIRVVPSLPWKGLSLRGVAMEIMRHADPFAPFDCRAEMPRDYIVRLGTVGKGRIVHGSGWNIYIGSGDSPISSSNDLNPVGPILSVIIKAAIIFFHNFNTPTKSYLFNALHWSNGMLPIGEGTLPNDIDLGTIWTVGVGSVGTSALYFLALTTAIMDLTLFDMDRVKVENMDRSPIFGAKDLGTNKVDVTKTFLDNMGIKSISAIDKALHESDLFGNRSQGVPDILIAAANEQNVRSVIESSFPPLQIYGTTGKNWQASMVRHVPLVDPCSCCLFPENIHAETACATSKAKAASGEKVDAALPFLSFAAGAMAASDILKTNLPGYPFTDNRAFLYTWGGVRLSQSKLINRDNCICKGRSKTVHGRMIAGSKYARFSISDQDNSNMERRYDV